MKIRILPQARQDLEIGADYYELKDGGLGADFLEAFLETSKNSRRCTSIRSWFSKINIKAVSICDLLSCRKPAS